MGVSNDETLKLEAEPEKTHRKEETRKVEKEETRKVERMETKEKLQDEKTEDQAKAPKSKISSATKRKREVHNLLLTSEEEEEEDLQGLKKRSKQRRSVNL